MKRPKAKSFEACEIPRLAQILYEHSLNNSLYDELGGDGFTWHGLVIYQDIPYIISIDNDGKFQYRAYKNQSAAIKAWDYYCIKYERWYIKHNG